MLTSRYLLGCCISCQVRIIVDPRGNAREEGVEAGGDVQGSACIGRGRAVSSMWTMRTLRLLVLR